MWGRGHGNDIIEDSRNSIFSGGFDVVEFTAGVAPEDIVLSREPNGFTGIVIGLADAPDTLTVRTTYDISHIAQGLRALEELRFADGTVWTFGDLRQKYLDETASDGDDTLLGFNGAEVLDGGAGDDYLNGWAGDDAYLFGFGSGRDVIEDSAVLAGYTSNDRVIFGAGVTTAMLDLGRDGADLIITLDGGPDSLTVRKVLS